MFHSQNPNTKLNMWHQHLKKPQLLWKADNVLLLILWSWTDAGSSVNQQTCFSVEDASQSLVLFWLKHAYKILWGGENPPCLLPVTGVRCPFVWKLPKLVEFYYKKQTREKWKWTRGRVNRRFTQSVPHCSSSIPRAVFQKKRKREK